MKQNANVDRERVFTMTDASQNMGRTLVFRRESWIMDCSDLVQNSEKY